MARQLVHRFSFMFLCLLLLGASGIFVYQISPLRNPSFQPNGANAGTLVPWLQNLSEGNWGFVAAVLAAILALIGYSINDTIVIFDRVRENFRKIRKGTSLDIMNASINQTLSRTIMTSGTTLLVVIALFIYGGEMLHGFALAMMIGIVVGTYSSIYVAGTLAVAMGLTRQDLLPTAKTEIDERP